MRHRISFFSEICMRKIKCPDGTWDIFFLIFRHFKICFKLVHTTLYNLDLMVALVSKRQASLSLSQKKKSDRQVLCDQDLQDPREVLRREWQGLPGAAPDLRLGRRGRLLVVGGRRVWDNHTINHTAAENAPKLFDIMRGRCAFQQQGQNTKLYTNNPAEKNQPRGHGALSISLKHAPTFGISGITHRRQERESHEITRIE